MSQVLDMLLSGLGVAGNVLDTPGALVRNTLSGRNPFSGLNPFDSEGRASGRDMLESWGALDANEEGLDWGDVAGFGAELATDPLNLMGLGAARKTATAAREARGLNSANAISRQVVRKAPDFQGFASMVPEELLREGSESLGFGRRVGAVPYETVEKILLGSRDEAAGEIAALAGLELTEPGQFAKDIYRASPASVYGFSNSPKDVGMAGMVHPMRGDLAFVGPEKGIRSIRKDPSSIAGHELLHSLTGMYPESAQAIYDGLGQNAVNRGWQKYRGASDWMDSAYSPSARREEGMATLIEMAHNRGSRAGDFPIQVVSEAALDPNYSDLLRQAVNESQSQIFSGHLTGAARNAGATRLPPDPGAVARLYTQFAAGAPGAAHGAPALFGDDLARSLSSAPTGPVHDFSLMSLVPDDVEVPSITPLLTMLLGHNTLARGSQF